MVRARASAASNEVDRIRASSDGLGYRTSTVYDAAGRSIARINPLQQRTSTLYDATGRSAASVDALNQRSSTVYDVAGREVARLVDEVRAPGRYSVRWTGRCGRGTAAAGIYFVRLQAGGRSAVRRLALLP